jgi:hypothetical protein
MRTIAIMVICIFASFMVKSQNVMTYKVNDSIKTIDVATIASGFNKVRGERVIINATYPNKELRKALIATWSRQTYTNLEDSVYDGIDENIVNTFELLSSNGNLYTKKLEFLCRLAYEKDGIYANKKDSLCIGINTKGDMCAGYLKSRDATLGVSFLYKKRGLYGLGL